MCFLLPLLDFMLLQSLLHILMQVQCLKGGHVSMRCSKRYMPRLRPFERLAEKTETHV